MNKKILAFAFVSAMLFLSCSADAIGPAAAGDPSQEDWKKLPGGAAQYCLFEDEYYGDYECFEIPPGFTAADCTEFGGQIVDSCHNY